MGSAYEEFRWVKTSPGVFQREVDEVEKFYFALAKVYEGSGRMFFAITGHLSLSISASDQQTLEETERRVDKALEQAWLALRLDHPTIASQVIRDQHNGKITKVYRPLLGNDEGAWLKATLVPISTGQTGEQWANNDPPAPAVATLYILQSILQDTNSHNSSVRRDLVLRSPHEIIDGIGTLLLLGNFTRLFSKIYEQGDHYRPPMLDGSEIQRLSPPFRVAAKVPQILTEAQNVRLRSLTEQKAAAGQDENGITVLGVPYRQGSIFPGKPQRVALELSTEDTSSILKACRSINATVTQAFHAAIAMVVRDVQPPQTAARNVRYVNYILRNERRSCVEPYNTPQHAAAVYHSVSGKALTVDMLQPAASASSPPNSGSRRQEFLRIIQTMKEFYEDVRDDKDHYAFASPIWGASAPPLPPLGADPKTLPVPPPKALPSVSISSMGRVDPLIPPNLGDIKSHNPWVTGEELGNGLGLFLGTYRDELCLSAAYNDAWHGEEEALDFLKRCIHVVTSGLSI